MRTGGGREERKAKPGAYSRPEFRVLFFGGPPKTGFSKHLFCKGLWPIIKAYRTAREAHAPSNGEERENKPHLAA